ncbi:MAG: DUF2341 domain-containing protein [Candidatus Hodarchaeales archaeon]
MLGKIVNPTKGIIIIIIFILVIFSSLFSFNSGNIVENETPALIDLALENQGKTNGISVNSKINDIPSEWTYKKIVTLNPATEQPNYQVKVILTKDNFNYTTAKSDGSDIRFCDLSYNPLSYWIESWNFNDKSIIWVNIPSSGTDRFLMYSGNLSAISESDGEATFPFFDGFAGTDIDTNKWTKESDIYSSLEVKDGIIHLTSAVSSYQANSVWLGLTDTVLDHGTTFGLTLNNAVVFSTDSAYIKANSSETSFEKVIPNESWQIGDIRFVSSSLVQFYNNSNIIAVKNSNFIPSINLSLQLGAKVTDSSDGKHYGSILRSLNSWGEGYAIRSHFWYKYPTDDINEVKCDWILIRKCGALEPAATVVNEKIEINSPKNQNYPGPMEGYYPASYGFENDPSFPFGEPTRTLSGQPPDGWIPHYPGQTGAIRVIDEYMGHKKVVELLKSRGSFGKARVGITKYFPTSATSGTIEFWFNKDSETGFDATKFILLGSGGSIELGIENQALYRGVYTSRINISEYVFPKDIWKHVRVDFDISQGGWQVQLDNTWYGSGYAFPFEGTPTEITGFDTRSHGIEFQTGLASHDFYLDALGYSWDPFYNVGDNLNEGILLDFEPTKRSRTDWEGYYPASQGFDEIPDGGQPENWGYWQGGSTSSESIPAPEMYVIDSKADSYGNTHNRVLYCQDNSGGTIFNGDGIWSSPRNSGTVDIWFLITNNQYLSSWGLLAYNTTYYYTARLGLDSYLDGDLSVWDGSTRINVGIDLLQNKWYRFSIDFSEDGTYAGLSANTYRVRWYDSDGKSLIYSSPDLKFQYNASSAAFHTSTGDSTRSLMYIDALGYSWDPNYNIGDNRLPSVYESEELAEVSLIQYSLDNQPNITISGITTVPMPLMGEHTINLFIEDSYGIKYNILQEFLTEQITLVTPEEKNYVEPMSGFYPASCGFENEPDDTIGLDIDFFDEYYTSHPSPTSFVYILVQHSQGDHNKTLHLVDAQASGYTWGVHTFDSPQVSGTVEFYLQVVGTAGAHYFQLRAANDLPAIQMRATFTGSKLQYYDGSAWQDIADLVKDTWFHHSISFDCEAGVNGQFTWIVSFENGTEFNRVSNIEFQNYLSSIDELYLGTSSSGYQIGTHYDAFGFSWDPNYNKGDNKEAGILVGFKGPTTFNWTGYSLDHKANVTILGNKTIPLSHGNHTIQIFGNDSSGIFYQSVLRKFQVEKIIPLPPVINSPSDFSINCGDTGYFILWSATDPSPANYTIYRNSSIFKADNWIATNIIASLDGLEEGKHNFTCLVENSYGLQSSDEVWITVLPMTPDISPPVISSPDDMVIEEGSIGY